MSANINPIFGLTPHVSFVNIGTNAVTGTDGISADTKTVFTATSNGSRIDDVYIQPLGTNSSDSTIRFYVNNGSDHTVATNNALIHEETLVASTISQTAAASAAIKWAANLILPPGYVLLVNAGTALAGDAKVTAVGSDF